MNIGELPSLFLAVLSGDCPVGVLADACEDCDDSKLNSAVEELRAAEVGQLWTTLKQNGRYVKELIPDNWYFRFKTVQHVGYRTEQLAKQGLRDHAVQLLHAMMPSFDTLPAFFDDVLSGSMAVHSFSQEVAEVGLTETAKWLRRLVKRDSYLSASSSGTGGGASVVIGLLHEGETIAREAGEDFPERRAANNYDALEEWPTSLSKQMCGGHDPLGFVAVREVKRQVDFQRARILRLLDVERLESVGCPDTARWLEHAESSDN